MRYYGFRRNAQMRFALALLFLFACVGITAQNTSTSQLVSKVENAIFTVFAEDEQGSAFSQGSGFFISPQGIGITNYHVLDGAHSGYIKTKNGTKYRIKNIIDYNPYMDLIKFQVDNIGNSKFKYLDISHVTPTKGEQILSISSPLGLEYTASTGIVSSIRTDETHGSIIQITAPISHGSSGSPVMNMKGQVIGIATFCREGGQNLNFAVNATQIYKLNQKRNIQVSQMVSNPLETELVKSANDAYFAGNINEALTLLNKELSLNPQNHLALFTKGMIEYNAGQIDLALGNLNKACDIGKNISYYYKLLGRIYLRIFLNTGNADFCELSLATFGKALEITNYDAELLFYIGNLYYQYAILGTPNPYSSDNQELYARALQAFSYSIELYPTAEAYAARANVKKMIQDYNGAIIDCDKAIELAPDYYRGYFTRGDIKIFDLKSFDGIVDLGRALALVTDPKEKADILGVRATAYETKAFQELGSDAGELVAKAIQDYSDAYELDSKPLYKKFQEALINKLTEYVKRHGTFP